VHSSAASSAVTAVTALEVPTVTVEPAVETTAETPRFLVFGANTAGVAAGAAVDFRHPKKSMETTNSPLNSLGSRDFERVKNCGVDSFLLEEMMQHFKKNEPGLCYHLVRALKKISGFGCFFFCL